MSNKKILVVSTSDTDRSKIIEFLVIVSPDYDGYGANSLEQVEEHLKNEENGKICAMICDCQLNGNDTSKVIEKVLSIAPNLPIILTPQIDELSLAETWYQAYKIHDIVCKNAPLKYLETVVSYGITTTPK